MKNYWLERKDSTIEIKQVIPSIGTAFSGKWYIAKSKTMPDSMDDWLWSEDYGTNYLHSDGKWRRCTVNEDGEYTGYFDTIEDAEKALYRL